MHPHWSDALELVFAHSRVAVFTRKSLMANQQQPELHMATKRKLRCTWKTARDTVLRPTMVQSLGPFFCHGRLCEVFFVESLEVDQDKGAYCTAL